MGREGVEPDEQGRERRSVERRGGGVGDLQQRVRVRVWVQKGGGLVPSSLRAHGVTSDHIAKLSHFLALNQKNQSIVYLNAWLHHLRRSIMARS